jgi:hypothetical protein
VAQVETRRVTVTISASGAGEVDAPPTTLSSERLNEVVQNQMAMKVGA